MNTTDPDCKGATVRNNRSFYERGAFVQKILRVMPNYIPRQIEDYVEQLGGLADCKNRFLMRDMFGVLEKPGIRAYVLDDRSYASADLWAAVASVFAETSWRIAPGLAGLYVLHIIPTVVRVVRPLAGIMRLDQRSEPWVALNDHRQESLRMSVLGPLAIFFFLTVARAELAWDVLVDRQAIPRHSRPFGWAPSCDALLPSVRFLLTGQVGRQLKPNALLYSPLAKYLLQSGLVQRVQVMRGGSPARNAGHWLLGNEYLRQSQSHLLGGGKRAVMVDESRPSKGFWEAEDAGYDYRTKRRPLRPEEELESLEIRRRAVEAAKIMLQEYAKGKPVQLKRLALWAHVANMDDPASLLSGPAWQDDRVWTALIDALITERVGDRATGVDRLNKQLPVLAAMFGIKGCTPFTTTQFGTYLTRLRQHYHMTLRRLVGPLDSL